MSGVVELGVRPARRDTDVLLCGRQLVGSDTSAPSAWKWNSTAVREGQHRLRAVVRLAGSEAQATVTVTVDNTAPSGSLSGPALTQDALDHLDHPV